MFLREDVPSRKSVAQDAPTSHNPRMRQNDFRTTRPGPILALVFALALLGPAAQAAELPTLAKKPKPPETAQGAKKCNIGGLTGVVAANGVCVRLAGSISAGVSAGQIK